MSKDYTRSIEILPCCGHSCQRHIHIGGGGNGEPGEYICLTGFCMCGRIVVKPQKRRNYKSVVQGEVEDELSLLLV